MSQEVVDPRARFFVISALRIAGVVMVLVGILMVRGVIETIPWVGYILIVIGLIDVFVMPQVLARKWRTPPGLDSGVGPRSGE